MKFAPSPIGGGNERIPDKKIRGIRQTILKTSTGSKLPEANGVVSDSGTVVQEARVRSGPTGLHTATPMPQGLSSKPGFFVCPGRREGGAAVTHSRDPGTQMGGFSGDPNVGGQGGVRKKKGVKFQSIHQELP